jgi:elongator complex protein 2
LIPFTHQMPAIVENEYYSVGGNRHSGAADWSVASGLLAFGADQNVAIWSMLDDGDSGHGIVALLAGHSSKVTAVQFVSLPQHDGCLVTGSANGEILVWRRLDHATKRWICSERLAAHDGTVNTIATLGRGQSDVFVTGGADATVKLWKLGEGKPEALSTLSLEPRYIPLTLAMGLLPGGATQQESAFLVVGGTRNDIQVYAVDGLASGPRFKLCATLTGHEAWVRSLAVTKHPDGGLLLASASQDKYVRLWRFESSDGTLPKQPLDSSRGASKTLSAKVQSVSSAADGSSAYNITFEALLLGHEDWVYSAAWSPAPLGSGPPQLLTASADGSLSIWESDPSSGIWISVSRLGEISGQKGATTATGSAGGFWTGLWSPDGGMVTCLGRTGGWRLWEYDPATQFWGQKHAVGGHVGSVNGICWAPDGSYLLSTSTDQTTRLHAEWKRPGTKKRSWHEFSRPQIHGYDLNCLASTTPHQFCSGADEKLLRVFNEPKDVASMLHRLCEIALPPNETQLPETAAIPVLGLSNKAVDDSQAAADEDEGMEGLDPATATTNVTGASLLDIEEPPNEDLLARHTLWPEHEKLYGHGYEISEASSSEGILATACKASSIDHAVIRLYDTTTWNEVKPPLRAHSLTVTRLAFSSQPPGYLLSVGRDRQWAVFRRDDAQMWNLVAINPKAHSRMVLDAVWLADSRPTFATAGRDKVVRIWSAENATDLEPNFICKASIARKSAVTAISATSAAGRPVVALGEDDGSVSLHTVEDLHVVKTVEVDRHLCPSKSVNRLTWRPMPDTQSGQLAVASADGSVRILRVDWEELSNV